MRYSSKIKEISFINFCLNIVRLVKLLKVSDWDLIRKCARLYRKKGYHFSIIDAIGCFFIYNTTIDEYYYYYFYKQTRFQRAQWLPSRIGSKFESKVNEKQYRRIVEDKYATYVLFQKYFKRAMYLLNESLDEDNFQTWLAEKRRFVLKPRDGGLGIGFQVIESSSLEDGLKQLHEFQNKGTHICEDFIMQHPLMSELNPGSVNTMRIVSYQDDNEVVILNTVVRMGNGGLVDNISAGGLTAPVDTETGIITGPAVTYDPVSEKKYENHPISGKRIVGVKIPFWKETLDMVKDMSSQLDHLRCPGWDIAITEEGPVLVEVNVCWSAALFQIPFQRGNLELLIPYMDKKILKRVHRKCFANIIHSR